MSDREVCWMVELDGKMTFRFTRGGGDVITATFTDPLAIRDKTQAEAQQWADTLEQRWPWTKGRLKVAEHIFMGSAPAPEAQPAAEKICDEMIDNLRHNVGERKKKAQPVPEQGKQPSEGPKCRYTGNPLEDCSCVEGCETNRVVDDEWIQPVEYGYKMTCCDCGLAHLLDFRVHEGHIQFRAFRVRPEIDDPKVRIAKHTVTICGKTWEQIHSFIDDLFVWSRDGEDIPFESLLTLKSAYPASPRYDTRCFDCGYRCLSTKEDGVCPNCSGSGTRAFILIPDGPRCEARDSEDFRCVLEKDHAQKSHLIDRRPSTAPEPEQELPPLGKSRTFWTSDATPKELEICQSGKHIDLVARLFGEREEQLLAALRTIAQLREQRDNLQRLYDSTVNQWAFLLKKREELERTLAQIRESKSERPTVYSCEWNPRVYEAIQVDSLLDAAAQREAAYKAAWERAEYDKTQIIKIGEEELAKLQQEIERLKGEK
jgi:hypothetical protein